MAKKIPFSIVLLTALAVGENPAALKARLRQAEVESSLDAPEIKPWHLKASFQLFDAKGQPAETGSVEEWYAGPALHKVVYSSPSYTNTEVTTAAGTFTANPGTYAPEMVLRVRDQIVHPMPEAKEVDDSTPYLEKKEIGKVPLDCIMLSQPLKNQPYPPLGLFPTFCLDRDKPALRISYDFGSMLIARNKMGAFLGRTVVIDQTVSLGSVFAAKAHLEQLNTLANPVPPELFATTGMTPVDAKPVLVSGGVIAGRTVHKVNPVYPERAKANHSSGTVVLQAIIGTDGRVHTLRLRSAPDPDLAMAALIAVRQWTYQPFLLNGHPTDVDTTITVNFKFGP